ncbi:hypothetical protein FJ946_30550 [Mesorhizobium sp. B2-4-7]|nr:hypothetical protein FJW11_29810 [Mesorhizobium sp. B3-1-1]TPJ37265.1 hypothetical protein FJ437_32445 [Mesorhizobium sp. B2-6-6]TPJ57581.1 hypothetical protein FJ462_31670 [Mesorhizobium sp. B2-6-7]TPJ76083.1 hypothetical protein FJ422_30600 [Mesorhizobium sp. B2-6-3]TPK02952.1 hypothetical protein FJ490_32195 [Mesorhizobium sp. B2-5-11]TPK42035.1 hypothetical protein FJ550_30430 [Mesorhizobium sp. B2-5-2]TPL07821.1 hypothetical protein FJ952_29680 [Mesorhizobium sp. B2-4-10]TPL16073.1 h
MPAVSTDWIAKRAPVTSNPWAPNMATCSRSTRTINPRRGSLNLRELKKFWLMEHRAVQRVCFRRKWRNQAVNSVIYLIGLVVVVLAILSFLGFH